MARANRLLWRFWVAAVVAAWFRTGVSGPYAAKVVAVAEPRDDYRNSVAEKYSIPSSQVFKTWQEFIAKPKMADAVVIATMDRDHVVPAVKCMELGYDILLEKPMGATPGGMPADRAAGGKAGCILGVCHSLRYGKGFRTLKEVVDSGAIGACDDLSISSRAWSRAPGAQLRSRQLGQRGPQHVYAPGQELPRCGLPRVPGRQAVQEGEQFRDAVPFQQGQLPRWGAAALHGWVPA